MPSRCSPHVRSPSSHWPIANGTTVSLANRVGPRVDDLPAFIETLKKAGLQFRNEMEMGPGDNAPDSRLS